MYKAWSQLSVLSFAKVRGLDSLRDIESSLSVQQNKLYHLGIKAVRRSTLSDANNRRYHHVFEDTYKGAIKMHTMLNHENGIPEFIHITDGKVADITLARQIKILPDSMILVTLKGLLLPMKILLYLGDINLSQA